MSIRFGTDGWRAVIAKEFTFDNVRRVAQAIADHVNSTTLPENRKPKTGNRLIVGYDTRFMSDVYAKLVSEVLAANQINVLLVDKPTPTPAISLAIKMKGLDGGVILTASHNPPIFNGIKFKTNLATSADQVTTGSIEKLIGKKEPNVLDFEKAKQKGRIKFIDVSLDYIKFIRNYVDIKKIRQARPKVLIDYMHGSGAGYLEAILGKPWPGIETIRGSIDPLFGGVNPEPIPKNLEYPFKYIRKKKFDLCVAMDGDADRIGALCPNGKFIESGQIISLILLHFIENRRLTGDVVKTISGTTLIEKICNRYNLTMFETAVGFKYVSALMFKENVLIGGEESGGIGFCGYIPERDGMLSALLLMEMLSYRKKSIGVIMRDMDKRYGRFFYGRIDMRYPMKKAATLMNKLKRNPPRTIAGKKLLRLKAYDGIKFILEDASWLLLRASGTEPLIRIYAEAGSARGVKNLLERGKNILG